MGRSLGDLSRRGGVSRVTIAARSSDLTDRLSEIDVPVLIVHGEEDPSIDPSRAGPMLEELPDAEMELVSEAGHASNLERPEPVNDAIRSFLDERF